MKKEKSSPKDFSPDDLPSTRWQEYWDFFKTRPGMFFALGGTMLLFFVPFLIAFLLKYYAVLSTAASQLSEEDFLSFSLTNTFVFDAVYAVCFLIFFLGLAGNARIIRQWAWGEGIYFWHDFGLGVKQNGKNYVLASLLFSLGHLLQDVIGIYVGNVVFRYLLQGLVLLLLPALLMTLSSSSIYSDSFSKGLGNSFVYCLKKPQWVLLFLLPCYGVAFFVAIDRVLLQAALYAGVVFLILPLYAVGWFLFSLSLFDHFTNQAYFPDYYLRGLSGEFALDEKEEGHESISSSK